MDTGHTLQKEQGIAHDDGRLQNAFVGRSTELNLLHLRIDDVGAGEGGLVLIAGEPGIGKTRLAEKAADYATRRSLRVLWGRSWEGEGAPAFWPWAQILRSLASETTSNSWLAALGKGAGDIARAIPELRELLPHIDIPHPSSESEHDRFRFFDSFTSFVQRLAAVEALMLVLDDLHSADQGSLLLLQFLSSAIAKAAVLIVGTYRDVNLERNQPLSRLLGTVNRERTTDTLVLGGLHHSEVRSLLQIALQSNPSDAVVQNIMERTEGNPLFLSEIVVLLNRCRNADTAGSPEPWVSVPRTLREVIGGHLQSVSPNCAAALAIASVNGREFDAEVLAEAMGTSTDEFCQIMDEAKSAKVVEHLRSMEYKFRHSLVRETIYESLSDSARAQLHLRIGHALEHKGHGSFNLSTLAHHFFMAIPYGSCDQAYEYAMRAGADASQRLAYEEAILHYDRALELSKPRPPDQSLCRLLLLLGEAQGRAGRWQESRRTFALAANEARRLGTAQHFAQAALGFKGMMWATIPVDTDAVTLLREAVSWLGPDEPACLVRVLSALTRCLYFAHVPGEVARYSEKAAYLARESGDDELILAALEAQITSVWNPSHTDDVFTLATELLDRSVQLGQKDVAFNARLFRNYCCLTRGDIAGSDVEISCAERLAGETGNVRYGWQVPMIRAARALARGNIQESERLSEVARSLGERVHDSSPIHNYMVQMFERARFRGVFTGIDMPIASAQETYPEIVGYRAAMALVLAHRGDVTRAEGILRSLAAKQLEAMSIDMLTLWVLTVLADAVNKCDYPSFSAALYERLMPFRECNIVMSWGAAFDGPVSHYLGVLATTLGNWHDAVSHFEHSLAMNNSTDSGPLLARTEYCYADALIRGRVNHSAEKAQRLLQAAIDAFDRFGMIGHLERGRDLLRSLEGCFSYGSGEVRDGLDARRVGMAVADGMRLPNTEYAFRREGRVWTIIFDGQVLRLQHTRGLAMLSILLERPGEEVHVLDLISAVEGLETVEIGGQFKRPGRPRKVYSTHVGDAGPLIDAQARAQYRLRAGELRAELLEAERFNDIGRAERIRAELEQVAQELSRAYGQGGRSRIAAAASERARINVRNNLTTALNTLKRFDAALWRHLSAAVRTGAFCSYRPERPFPWSF